MVRKPVDTPRFAKGFLKGLMAEEEGLDIEWLDAEEERDEEDEVQLLFLWLRLLLPLVLLLL